ncbi:AraC family transcriptional regulator [Vagococcus martis]|uniref:AraC family transcriptional regulator n=1 Tax=Vagococcus martis TaxID=1768210 RepID=A0A1V4DHU3_9ENTE|nr:AraC family transcriptional regulator [Vagococcus martis]OPF88127.1 AraC family transcriptional regulator [Vagococcus martis]
MSLYLEIPEWDNSLPFRAFENQGEIVVPPHWHKEIEMIYVTKGLVNIGYDNQLFQVQEGEIFIFGSGESHYFLASPGSTRIVYQFDLTVFQNYLVNQSDYKDIVMLFEKAENLSRFWGKDVEQEMRSLVEKLFKEVQQKKLGYDYAILSLLHQLLVFYYREIPQKNRTLKEGNFVESAHQKQTLERLNDVFIYIENHFQEVITLEDVAKYVGFSPYYFSRFFKKNTGQNFSQFLTEYRLNQAKYILSHENIPMIEVAERSGFNSVKTFHHVFKEHVGLSPLKYHKTIYGNN